MRFRRVTRRALRIAFVSCLVEAGFYAGRLTVRVRYVEWIALGAYLVCALLNLSAIHREYKRERKEFVESMRRAMRERSEHGTRS